jgi:hypothetical protein
LQQAEHGRARGQRMRDLGSPVHPDGWRRWRWR